MKSHTSEPEASSFSKYSDCSITVVMKSQTSEPSDDVPLLSNGRLYAGTCENIPRTFAHSVGLLHKILLLPPSVCVCLELCPSNATKAQPISTPTVSMEAPCLHLHSPLLASKAILWSLVVICTLFTRERFQPQLELPNGTSSYHALYMYEYISYV